ncbi:MAG: hypothetical protein WAX69_13875 [Victivallales bacterium]
MEKPASNYLGCQCGTTGFHFAKRSAGLGLGLLAALLFAVSALADRANEAAPPAVAIFSGQRPLPIAEHLRSKGWQTLYLQWGHPFDAAFLRRFNVIILSEYPNINPDAAGNNHLEIKPDYEEKVRRLLWDFVEGGGGLLAYGGDWPSNKKGVNPFLARWGIGILNEQVLDPAHRFHQKNGMELDYFYTDNISDHPVTRDVRTIFYPERTVYGAADNPLKPGSEWQVLIRGTEQARSFPIIMNQHYERPDEKQPGSYAKAPPLAAVRQIEQGRAAVFGWSPMQGLFQFGHYMVEDIHFTRGGDGRTSDGMRLLEQTLAWLAAPSMAAADKGGGQYGGYRNEPAREKAKLPDPILWTAGTDNAQESTEYWRSRMIGDPSPKLRWYRGVIGARTQLTGGKGTVAEYAAAARAAKLDFIGFMEWMEDISSVSGEQWDRFREECRKASGPDLLVLPGQAVRRGEAGDWYFRVSDFSSPPQRDFLTKDGKRINNYLYEHFAAGVNTLGPFDLRNQPSPSWVSRAYNSMAVTTTRDGRTDIDLEPFLYQTQVGDIPQPVAVDLITSPDQVAAAAGRYLNLRFCGDQDELRRTLKSPDNTGPAQISNGPLIRSWRGCNLSPRTFGRSIPGTERLMLRLQAESDQPLAEAVIYDGTKVFRRYRLDGRTCDFFIHALHDCEHRFVAVVRDQGGRIAVTSEIRAQDQSNYRFMCSDRQNSFSQSWDLDSQGYPVASAAAGNQWKVAGSPAAFPGNPQTVSRVPPYWDGAPGGYAQGGSAEDIQFRAPILSPQPPGTTMASVYRMEYPLGSRDVICQAQMNERVMADRPMHETGFWPMRQRDDYHSYARFIEFKKTPDAPATMLMEGYYAMLKDGTWEKNGWYWNAFSHIIYNLSGRSNDTCNWSFIDPAGGEFLSGSAPPKEKPASFVRTFPPNGYIAYAASHDSCALFPLDEPLLVAQELHSENLFRVWCGYGRIGGHYRKGDVIPFRLLVLTGSINTPPDTREIESFRRAFGLHGGKPAYSVTPRTGKVLNTRYVLELEARDGGFGGVIGKAALPARLPIRIHGVNPNWTSGIVERKEKWWLPLGVLDDLKLTPGQLAGPAVYSAYAALELNQDRDVWIGNVVTCDQTDLILTLLPDGRGGFSIEAHNSTDREIKAAVRLSAEFVLAPPFSQAVTVPAGSSVMMEIPHVPKTVKQVKK